MSLILEALRKSEAERRRGQTPDLLMEPAPMKRTTRTTLPRGWPWAAAFIAALAVVWLGRGAFTSTPEATEAEPRATVAQVDQSTAVLGEETPPAQASAPVRTPVPARDPASTSAATTAPPPVSSTPATTPAAPPAAPAPAPASTHAPAVAAARKPDVVPPTTAPAPVIAMPPTPGPAPVRAPAPAPAQQPQPLSPPPQTFTSPDTVLRLSELTTEERQQLPPLKISMHMWAPEPAQRFVIIDGNRVAEGDRVGSAVIEAITADGVTLAWQGRRIRLPIR